MGEIGLHEVKDKIQRKGLNIWVTNKCRGSLEYTTGVGKTRCGVLAAQWVVKNNPNANILILTPTKTIRDNAWTAEFKKWKATNILNKNIEIQCINTAYKFKGEHYDLVIADEIHNYIPLGEEYEFFKFFENNTFERVLGLSGSIDEKLKFKLDTVAPVIDSITHEEALDLGVISPFIIYNLPVTLTTEERAEYDKLCSKINYCQEVLNVTSWKSINARKDLLYNTASKVQMCKEISDLYASDYGIFFSQSTAFADKVAEVCGASCASYHSKISAKLRKENMAAFCDGRRKITKLSSAMALNEGANLPRVVFGVIASGNSTSRNFIQRLGRIIRLEEGKTAILIRLYVPGTQEEKWIASSQKDYSEVITINNLNYLKDGKEEKEEEKEAS